MSFQVGLSLLLSTMLASVQPTDYSQLMANIPSRCEKRVIDCGEFQAPFHPVGTYHCKFVAKKCAFSCALRCPSQRQGVRMTISNRRHARDLIVCSKGSWRRANTIRPQAYCESRTTVKEVVQNFHHIDELNELAQALFNTSYVYLGMASFYERADVALPGFSKFMTDLWQKEMSFARDVMSYVNKRGGYLTLYDIPRPLSHEMLLLTLASRPGQTGLEIALGVTRDINQRALQLRQIAIKYKRRSDPHLKFYLEHGLIDHKTEAIKEIADLVSRLQSFPEEDYKIGEYAMNLELAKEEN